MKQIVFGELKVCVRAGVDMAMKKNSNYAMKKFS